MVEVFLALNPAGISTAKTATECLREFQACKPITFVTAVQLSLLPSSLRRNMDIQLINIGFGNIVCANRVIAIVSPESAPIKRIINDARDRGQLVDATYGRRTRAVIITDSSHIVLSAIQPETVAHRFISQKEIQNEA